MVYRLSCTWNPESHISGNGPLSQTSLATRFQDFIEKNNYELSTGRLVGRQIQAMVAFLTLILLFIGGLIFILSLLIILLNFRLLIVQAQKDIRLLLQLGYKQKQIYSFLHKKLLDWFSILSFSAFILLLFLHWLLARAAQQQGLDIQKMVHPMVWLLAIVLSVAFVYLNYRSIRRKVTSL